jgi:broad specificity phosphatase PhoE
MPICKIYVVRHGQSEHNFHDIVSGHGDAELTDEGVEQARATKLRLSGVYFDEVYSSDLQRAIRTAEIISGRPVPKDHQLFELRERNFGELEGKPNQHLRDIHDKFYSQNGELTPTERWKHQPIPTMESDHQVAERFIAALTEIAKANMNKSVLVAAHGGTLRTTLVGLKHGSYDDFPPGSIKNASYIELSYDGKTLKVDSSDDTKA